MDSSNGRISKPAARHALAKLWQNGSSSSAVDKRSLFDQPVIAGAASQHHCKSGKDKRVDDADEG
jgi:hypothetical protein